MADTPSCLNMSLDDIAEACDGAVEERYCSLQACGLSTDTRGSCAGALFLALKGDTHDGHRFVRAAFDAGAVAAVVSDASVVEDGQPAIVVADTLVALGRIAAAHRAGSEARVAAITGSVAKTTTKDMLTGIMAGVGPTLSAEGTENNEVGVPLTLLRLCPEHRFCVLELAMRGPDEIAYLAEIVAPHVGLITNIGDSHVGRLGSRDAIASAKAELLQFLPADGVAVLNADDFYFSLLAELAPCPVLSFGLGETADLHATEVTSEGLAGTDFTLIAPEGRTSVHMDVPGRHNVMNALAAAATACALGASLDQIAAGLMAYAGTPMRMERVAGINGSVVINDAYNASPASMTAAFELLAEAEGRRILVFGDMLEMGAQAQEAHRRVGMQAVEAGVTWLIAVGEMAALAAEEARAAGVRADGFADAPDAAQALIAELSAGDIVLVKGSRGMALERVVEEVRDG